MLKKIKSAPLKLSSRSDEHSASPWSYSVTLNYQRASYTADRASPKLGAGFPSVCPSVRDLWLPRSQLLVHLLVLDQVPMLVEGTTTLSTLIGPLPRVDPLVLDEH